MMQPDGTGQKQLTVNAAVNGTLAVMRDNRYIVFMSNRTGAFQVWRMNIDGSNQIQLTYGTAKNFPSTSADGNWVLYNTTDDWHLWRVSIDGGEPIRLTEHPASYPSVSPDGKLIACVERSGSKQELLILPFDGVQPFKRIELAGGSFSGTRIQWTPDAKALIYAAERNGTASIFKQSLVGGQPQQNIDLGKGELFDFGYSFDGQSFAVTRGG